MRAWQLKPDSLIGLCHLRYRFARLKRVQNARPRRRIMSIVAVRRIRSRALSFFRLLPPGLLAKTLRRNNRERRFEDEETNPKYQYGSIRLAPNQKRHKGRHNS